MPWFCSQETPRCKTIPPSQKWSQAVLTQEQAGTAWFSGFLFDLVGRADQGLAGACQLYNCALPHWLEIRGWARPSMGPVDSLERRFVFPGGMDDFILADEVTRVNAIKRLIFTWKLGFKATLEGNSHDAPRPSTPSRNCLCAKTLLPETLYSRMKLTARASKLWSQIGWF